MLKQVLSFVIQIETYVTDYAVAGLIHFIRFCISSEMGGERDCIA